MKPNTSQTETNTQELPQDKTIGVIAYLTLIGLIIAYVMNQEKKAEFGAYHIKQSLGLCLCGLGLFIVGLIPILGWIISILGSIFIIYLWIMGLMNALNNTMKPIPLLGKKFEEWFKKMWISISWYSYKPKKTFSYLN